MVAIGDERGAVESFSRPCTNSPCDLVPGKSDDACGREPPEVRQVTGVDEPLDGLHERNAGTHENREDDKEACEALATGAAEEEGQSERDGGQRVTEVVNEVGEEGDAQRPGVQEGLNQRCHGQDTQADGNRANACARAQNGAVYQAMRVAVTSCVRMVVRSFVPVRSVTVVVLMAVVERMTMWQDRCC